MQRRRLRLEDKVVVSVLDPTLFSRIEAVCRDSISLSQNHPMMRKAVSALYLRLRELAIDQVGHETPDVVALRQMLERTDENRSRLATRDPLILLHESRQIDEDQLRAARMIVTIWRAFGRYLSVSGRAYDGQPGAKRTKAADPAAAIGKSVEFDWKNFYTPWYEHARNKRVPCRAECYGARSAASIVLEIVVQDVLPKKVDEIFRLPKGTAVRVLREELGDLAGRMEGAALDRPENS